MQWGKEHEVYTKWYSCGGLIEWGGNGIMTSSKQTQWCADVSVKFWLYPTEDFWKTKEGLRCWKWWGPA